MSVAARPSLALCGIVGFLRLAVFAATVPMSNAGRENEGFFLGSVCRFWRAGEGSFEAEIREGFMSSPYFSDGETENAGGIGVDLSSSGLLPGLISPENLGLGAAEQCYA